MVLAGKLNGKPIPALLSLSSLAIAAVVHVGNGPRYSYTFLPSVYLFICATICLPLSSKFLVEQSVPLAIAGYVLVRRLVVKLS